LPPVPPQKENPYNISRTKIFKLIKENFHSYINITIFFSALNLFLLFKFSKVFDFEEEMIVSQLIQPLKIKTSNF
jgi:hypothetical protein